MMSYEESAAEIRKRRDAIIQNKKNKIKKAITVLSVVLLFTVVGGASIFIGLDRKDAPQKPPKVTVALITNGEAESSEGTSDLTDKDGDSASSESVTESDPEPTDSESETGSEPETTEREPKPTKPENPTETPTEIDPITSDKTPEDESTEDTITAPPPPTTDPDGAHYEDFSTSSGETDDPNVVPPSVDGDDEIIIDPPEDVKAKYTESFSYLNNTYYFEGTDIFYDGVSPLPLKIQRSQRFGNSIVSGVDSYIQKKYIKDYVARLYGDEYDYDNFRDTLGGHGSFEVYYTTNDPYVTEREIGYLFGGIEFDLNISAVDGFFNLKSDEVFDYVKNMKYYQAAIEYLDIEEPFIEISEVRRNQTHSFNIRVYEREDYLGISSKNGAKGYIEVELNFDDYEDDSKDKVTANYHIELPYYLVALRESSIVPYDIAKNQVLTKYDFGDDFEYVKDNLKCIIHYAVNGFYGYKYNYAFYVEYTDSNGSKYYKFLDRVSMFDEENAYDVPYVEPEIKEDTEIEENPVVRPTDGPSVEWPYSYSGYHTTMQYNSYEGFRDEFINFDKGILFHISEIEKKYLFETINKTIVSDDEIRYGIFGNFRKNILDNNSIMIPYIDGKSLLGEYNEFTHINLMSSNDSSRKPSIFFSAQHPELSAIYPISIYTTYMDPAIAKEAEAKGGTWATSVMFPEAMTTVTYDDWVAYYAAQGIDIAQNASVYEKEYNIGGRTVLTAVYEHNLDKENPSLTIRFTFDDIYVCIMVKSSIAEEVLANFALYECDLNTGKPLRDTPGRSEGFWTEN